MDLDYKEIGQKIKFYRKRAALTQAELGQLIGKTVSSVNKYEKGVVEIPLKVIELIGKTLGVPLEEFIPPQKNFSYTETSDMMLKKYLQSLGYDFSGTVCKDRSGNIIELPNETFDYVFWKYTVDNQSIECASSKGDVRNAFDRIEFFVKFTLEELLKKSVLKED